jgi:hypothetical protein
MEELLSAYEAGWTSRGHGVPAWLQNVRKRALSGDMVNIGRLEPHRTIYGREWTAAVEAVTRAPLDQQPDLRSILSELEAGWARVRPILELAADEPTRIDQSDAVGLFAIDVAELFRSAVFDCAGWLAAYADALRGRTTRVPDHENILSDIARFATYAAILGLAADTSGVDPRLDGAAQTLAREAHVWADKVERAIRAVPELALSGVHE